MQSAPNDSRSISPKLIARCGFAAVAGMFCLVLAPYLTENALQQPAYGWTLIPWFALEWANVRAIVSMISFFVLGLTLGVAEPRRWLLLTGVATAASPVLLAINILFD